MVALGAGGGAVLPLAGEAEVVRRLAADVVVAEVVVEQLGVGERGGAAEPFAEVFRGHRRHRARDVLRYSNTSTAPRKKDRHQTPSVCQAAPSRGDPRPAKPDHDLSRPRWHPDATRPASSRASSPPRSTSSKRPSSSSTTTRTAGSPSPTSARSLPASVRPSPPALPAPPPHNSRHRPPAVRPRRPPRRPPRRVRVAPRRRGHQLHHVPHHDERASLPVRPRGRPRRRIRVL